MPTSRPTLALLPLVLLLGGCGDDVESQADTSQCAAYQDEQGSGSHVTVRLVNQRAEPIFFLHWEGCSTWGDLGGVQAPDGSDAAPPSFGFSCEFWQDNATMPAVGCEQVRLTAVAPGDFDSMDWAPLYYESRDMPDSCFAGEVHRPCTQARAATAGTYVFSASAHTAATGCVEEGLDPCACDGPTSGTCTAVGMGLSLAGDTVEASASLVYPDLTEVEIVFQ